MPDFLLAIDQGTTSSRAIVFGADGLPRGSAQIELPQIYPHPGWVEHDPDRIWQDSVTTCRAAVSDAGLEADDIAAIGIANQRETVVVWERASGRPIHNAIVWQDRRTARACDALREEGHEDTLRMRTGLVADPYFSATKLAWLLDSVDGARAAARRGELAFGTIDSFLLWHLTGGEVHATDVTNASRTLLFDIRRLNWDEDLFELFDIPLAMAPEVRSNVSDFGFAEPSILGRAVPICGIAGDQQAAAIGQACIRPGMIKATYGTGAFILLDTGPDPVLSENRLLTTVAFRVGDHCHYAVEGSIFVAGAAVQWLRDGVGVIGDAADTEALAESLADTGDVYLVPAFAGLGAPHWDAAARGAIVGLTQNSGAAQLVRAALEAAAFQTYDVLAAMTADGAAPPLALRVDGGMAANSWMLGFLADIANVRVERPVVTETTALGAVILASIGVGWFADLTAAERMWRLDRGFDPAMTTDRRANLLGGWQRAVEAVCVVHG
ncbi:MAG: glycerol kinase GlpK [Alphaproteobacteria bacterium]|nr:glycerol kinase GlpK [Alphaproteobacteria bacterium]